MDENRDKIYETLRPREIRLLSINPALPDENIECSLITAGLDQLLSFDALSYVWGPETPTEEIHCNGIPMRVRKNLANALRRLRPLPAHRVGRENRHWASVDVWKEDHVLHSSHNAWKPFARNRHEHPSPVDPLDCLLWADAICINQNDLDERAEQVKLMQDIYPSARRVLLWFGIGDTEPIPHDLDDKRRKSFDDPLWKVVQAVWQPTRLLYGGIASAKERVARTVRPTVHLGQFGSMPIVLSFIAQAIRNVEREVKAALVPRARGEENEDNVTHGLPDATSQYWQFVQQFFEHPYFRRVWIVQEVVLATKAVALVGDWEIEWSALGKAAAWFLKYKYMSQSELPQTLRGGTPTNPATNAAELWKMHEQGMRTDLRLLPILKVLRQRMATDKVDKVFAAFGLAEETRRHGESPCHPLVETTYATSTKLVYRNVAKFLIINNGNLEVLSSVGGSQEPGHDWPSWVPDWSRKKTSIDLTDTHQQSSPYDAGRNEPLTIGDSLDENVLSLKGVECDEIIAFSTKFRGRGSGEAALRDEHDFIVSAWNLATSQQILRNRFDQGGRRTERPWRSFTATVSAGFGDNESLLDVAEEWLNEHIQPSISLSSLVERQYGLFSRHPYFQPPSLPGVEQFRILMVRMCRGRRFFITRDGLIGLGPELMKERDILVVLFGGKVPFILRPIEGGYRLIGDCYSPQLMKGEAVTRWTDRGSPTKLFNIL